MNECLSEASDPTGTVEMLIRGHVRTPQPVSDLWTLVLELEIQGLARFLSHADLQRALMRSCVRAQLNLRYSQGFNPHPKMSLPLPKSVGLASCGDILCVRLQTEDGEVLDALAQTRMQRDLEAQLPQGIVLRRLHVVPGKITLYAREFTCTYPLKSDAVRQRVAARIPEVMACERLLLERANPQKPSRTKKIDIRPYIASMKLVQQTLQVNCLINDAGTIRVEEILASLGLVQADLDGPVRRGHLRWQLQSCQ